MKSLLRVFSVTMAIIGIIALGFVALSINAKAQQKSSLELPDVRAIESLSVDGKTCAITIKVRSGAVRDGDLNFAGPTVEYVFEPHDLTIRSGGHKHDMPAAAAEQIHRKLEALQSELARGANWVDEQEARQESRKEHAALTPAR